MNGVISGRVVDASGAPVPGATVAVSSVSGGTVSDIASLTDAEGNYRRGGLAPGSYTLEVHKSGQPPRAVQFDIAAGQQVRVDVQLDA